MTTALRSRSATPMSVNLAVFFDTIGSGMVFPISMLYFITFGKVELSTIGQLASLAGFLSLPMGIPGGLLSDRLSSKALLVIYNLLCALGYSIYLLPITKYSIFWALFFTAVGAKFYYTGWTVFVNDVSAGSGYEKKFSIFETIKMGSMAIGSAISTLATRFCGNDILHLLMIINICMNIAAAWLLYRAPLKEKEAHSTLNWQQVYYEAKRIITHSSYRKIVCAQFFLAPMVPVLSTAGIVFVKIWHMPLYVNNLWFFVNMIVITVFQIPLNNRFNRYPARITLYTTIGLLAIAILPYAFWHYPTQPYTWIIGAVTVVALSLATVISAPVMNSIMARKADEGLAGQTVGVFQTSATVGAAFYPLTLGLIEGPYAWCVWVGSFICLLLAVLLFISVDMKPSQEKL